METVATKVPELLNSAKTVYRFQRIAERKRVSRVRGFASHAIAPRKVITGDDATQKAG